MEPTAPWGSTEADVRSEIHEEDDAVRLGTARGGPLARAMLALERAGGDGGARSMPPPRSASRWEKIWGVEELLVVTGRVSSCTTGRREETTYSVVAGIVPLVVVVVVDAGSGCL